MNEPSTGYWGAYSPKQEGCHVDPGEAQSKIIVATAKAFATKGLGDVEIVASDETSPKMAVKSYKAYSDEAKTVLDRINTHSYSVDGMSSLAELSQTEGFNLWMSEVDGDGVAGTNAGEMSAALYIANKIIGDIYYMEPSAWIMWQAGDNHISSEGYNGIKDSGAVDLTRGFWGATMVDHDKQQIIRTQKYYGIGQFTRYIRPGSTLILCDGDTLAAYDSAEKELIIVSANMKAEDKEYFFDLSKFSTIGTNAQQIRTSGTLESGEHWAQLEDITLDKNGLYTYLKGNSITTFIINDVTLE